MNTNHNLSLTTLAAKTTGLCHWVAQAAASPSTSAFIASSLYITIFGSDEDPPSS